MGAFFYVINLKAEHHHNVTWGQYFCYSIKQRMSFMSKIFGILILSLSVFLTACNDDDEQQDVKPQPEPQPTCKMHCAP